MKVSVDYSRRPHRETKTQTESLTQPVHPSPTLHMPNHTTNRLDFILVIH